jgi:RimJ/RimL family protein N-acetyltransferase
MSTAILRDFPSQFESERLLLRAPGAGDGEATYLAVMESLPELRPYMARTDLMLLIFLKSSGVLLGGSGLHNIDWRVPRFEIGYWLRTRYTGHGYMTEAVNAIAAFAFDILTARRVEIRCDERNTRSAAVARRCGFNLEGILRHNGRDHLAGDLENTMVFASIK